jgi:hypothetical protein
MGTAGDIAREDFAQFLCRRIAEKIEKYPEAGKALKEIGLEVLDELPGYPKWADEYYCLFRN